MVTFQNLGNYGRLGNQLFQIAATLGYGVRYGERAVFPKWEYDLWFKGKLDQSLQPEDWKSEYQEQGFHFQDIPHIEDVSLLGVFQSEKYFEHCSDLIRNQFAPSKKSLNVLQTKYIRWLQHPCTCAIHVRRGDYLDYQDRHPVQPFEYYRACMNRMKDIDPEYLIFSDDLKWCREHFSGKRIQFIEGAKDVIDLLLMSSCKHAIIANSSFSWWAAWLNNNHEKRVFAPQNWFGPALKAHDTKDLLPKSWTTVSDVR